MRTLIVSGGPNVKYNQYAIESNARYVEKLTAGGRSQRVLFADGSPESPTISAPEKPEDARELVVLAWLLDEKPPADKLVLKAPTLRHLDGDATPKNIVREVEALAKTVQTGERGLIYFTGHGSAGRKDGPSGSRPTVDFDNTVYNGWQGNLSVRELAPSLQSWPSDVPLTVVMVQCHSGGFANLIWNAWNGSDSPSEVWPRDFCGFFATTGERLAAGCTNEVNEEDYQDFTTHFFAALSGVSRDGRIVKRELADFDKNGTVSGLEALAYTDLYDDSIDVPLCTSDVYLRRIFTEPTESGEGSWVQTPFSTVLKQAAPWQKAILNGLSRELGLSGETRTETAFATRKDLGDRLEKTAGKNSTPDDFGVAERDDRAVSQPLDALKQELFSRFPDLKAKGSLSYAASKIEAVAYLKTRPAQVAALYAVAANGGSANARYVAEKREAKLLRFLRAARTVVLQKRLQEQGTAEQKAVFSRLRTSETRNFLK